jgi:outer membrane protein OmpU
MKKILLATTMLIGTAGFAAAEVSVSGDARMGIEKTEGSDAVFSNRARVKFSLSGETDGGIAFGAGFRADNAAGAAGGSAGAVSISGAFGSLSMGDESAAAEYAVGDLSMISFAGAGDGSDTTFLTGAKVVYTYSAGDLSVFLSTGTVGSDANSIGVKYSAGGLTVGAGYETDGTNDHTAASVAYAMGATTIKVVYGTADQANKAAVSAVNPTCATIVPGVGGAAPTLSNVVSATAACPAGTIQSVAGTPGSAAVSGLDNQMGISVSHTMGALSLAAYYRVTENNAGVESDYAGVGASYDLGGGAAVKGGIADINGTTKSDIGLTFSF